MNEKKTTHKNTINLPGQLLRVNERGESVWQYRPHQSYILDKHGQASFFSLYIVLISKFHSRPFNVRRRRRKLNTTHNNHKIIVFSKTLLMSASSQILSSERNKGDSKALRLSYIGASIKRDSMNTMIIGRCLWHLGVEYAQVSSSVMSKAVLLKPLL